MARTPKALAQVEGHLTKAQRETRENAEKQLSSNEKIEMSAAVKKSKIAKDLFKRVTALLDSIGMDDAFYEAVINRYCVMTAECETLEHDLQRTEELLDLGGGGGGGGYTLTEHAAYVLAGRGYAVTIGSGGAANAGSADPSKSVAGDGGYSRFADLAKASGGKGASKNGGDGGSGGGGAAYTTTEQSPRVGRGGNGGTNGGNGNAGADGVSNGTAGNGQGTTTREFGETTGTLYSGGGAGGGGNGGDVSGNSSAGEANTGGGGGGGIWNNYGSSGGSGVVVIRNTRNQPVVITQQPQDVSAAENANAVFTVAASGTGLTYKWQFLAADNPYAWADTSAAGYNTDTLTVQALAYRNGYKYRCIITNADGVKTTSLPAALAIAE